MLLLVLQATADDLTIKLLDGGTLTNASMGNINLSTVTATTGTLISDNFSISGLALTIRHMMELHQLQLVEEQYQV